MIRQSATRVIYEERPNCRTSARVVVSATRNESNFHNDAKTLIRAAVTRRLARQSSAAAADDAESDCAAGGPVPMPSFIEHPALKQPTPDDIWMLRQICYVVAQYTSRLLHKPALAKHARPTYAETHKQVANDSILAEDV